MLSVWKWLRQDLSWAGWPLGLAPGWGREDSFESSCSGQDVLSVSTLYPGSRTGASNDVQGGMGHPSLPTGVPAWTLLFCGLVWGAGGTILFINIGV